MVRNPWGIVKYNGTLSSNDYIWNDQTILNQVPLGVNPITDGLKYGIFIVPSTLFSTCFSEYQIGHFLDNSGYTSATYD
jgi:hypothetical protein